MENQPITEVSSHKQLGIIFSNDCTWHEHLENVEAKAWKRINIMRKLKFKLNRKSLQTIYFSFIRPLLEYAIVRTLKLKKGLFFEFNAPTIRKDEFSIL